jgi:hypothetical protein
MAKASLEPLGPVDPDLDRVSPRLGVGRRADLVDQSRESPARQRVAGHIDRLPDRELSDHAIRDAEGDHDAGEVQEQECPLTGGRSLHQE